MFKVGDRVRYGSGNVTYRVETVKHGMIVIRSASGGLYPTSPDKLVYASKPYEKPKEEKMKLYQFEIEGKTTYGHKLAADSQGNWVMESKGSNQVVAVDPKLVVEVIPFTIGVKFLGKDQEYHYTAAKDKYQVGQIFLMNGNYGPRLATISAVDTKSLQATKEFNPVVEVVTKGV